MTKLSIDIDTDKPKDIITAYNILDAINQSDEPQQQEQPQEQYIQHPTMQQAVLPTAQPLYQPQVQAPPIQMQQPQQPRPMPQGQSMKPESIQETYHNEESW
jgi:hypothetical protein